MTQKRLEKMTQVFSNLIIIRSWVWIQFWACSCVKTRRESLPPICCFVWIANCVSRKTYMWFNLNGQFRKRGMLRSSNKRRSMVTNVKGFKIGLHHWWTNPLWCFESLVWKLYFSCFIGWYIPCCETILYMSATFCFET